MAKKEYDTFTDSPDKVPGTPTEMALAIRELAPDDRRKKYVTRYVKAIVCSDPAKMPDSDTLWFRWQRGRLYPKVGAIKIVEELGPYLPKEVKVRFV